MTTAFFITLREGVEAALIIGIIFAYLAMVGKKDWFRYVWWGTGAAVIFSIVVGAVAFIVTGSLPRFWAQMIEGVASLLAVGVLTYMIFWMRKQSRHIKQELHEKIDKAIAIGSPMALVALALATVGREGFETALFMFAVVKSSTATAAATGGLLGLATATVLGYLLYKGGLKLNLRTFFNVTSVLIILFAAGLLSYGIRELQALGFMPPLVKQVWNMNSLLNENQGLGTVFRIVFNYNANPSLIEAASYLLYMAGALLYYFKPERRAPQLVPQQVNEKA